MTKQRLSSAYGTKALLSAAPILRAVRISTLDGSLQSSAFDALVDTGADMTAVPIAVCPGLGVAPHNFVPVSGCDASMKKAKTPTYLVTVLVPELGGFELEVIAVERSNILLGRDWLKSLVLVLNGQSSTWATAQARQWHGLLFPARWVVG